MLKKLVRIRARKKEASWKENIRKYEWFTFPSISIQPPVKKETTIFPRRGGDRLEQLLISSILVHFASVAINREAVIHCEIHR